MAVALRMGQAVAGELAHGRGDAIDDHIRVLVDQPKERCPAFGNRLQAPSDSRTASPCQATRR